jgi:HAD superfamily hydrolase (TIGR01509 family)
MNDSPALRYDAVLLDIDGTLIDSNGAHAGAWSDALSAHGKRHSAEQIRPLIGKGGDKVLWELASIDHESDEGKAIDKARAAIFKERYLPTVKATPGAKEFVQWLIDSRLKVVIATSAKDDEIKDLLAICDGQALQGDATSSDDAKRSKPDPDIVAAALKKAGVSKERAVMIGDTPYDIEAAGRAGIRTIAFRCGGWDDASLKDAVAIYSDPKELLERVSESPLYPETS